MTEKEVLKIFDSKKALLSGHFRLSSGLHSEKYLQCALVLQYPEVAEKLSKDLARKFSNEKIDLVIGPALGGITLAYEVARALGVRGIFAERQEGPPANTELSCSRAGRMLLRRGFSIEKAERALVVEDVITTGGSTKEVIDVVKRSDGLVVGVGSIIDRSAEGIDFGVKFESLAKIEIETFEEKDCPLCKKNIPVTKPGSRI